MIIPREVDGDGVRVQHEAGEHDERHQEDGGDCQGDGHVGEDARDEEAHRVAGQRQEDVEDDEDQVLLQVGLHAHHPVGERREDEGADELFISSSNSNSNSNSTNSSNTNTSNTINGNHSNDPQREVDEDAGAEVRRRRVQAVLL